VQGVKAAVPEIGGSATLRFGNRDYQTSITATSADYPDARDWPLRWGTFFSEEDVAAYAPVAVLGQTVVDNLFEGADPLGQYVLVNSIPFQVVGVLDRKGAGAFGNDLDDGIFIPLTTGSLRVIGQRHLRSITIQSTTIEGMQDVQDRVTELLISRHRTEDFQIRNMASIVETATEAQNTMTVLLGSIAAISLLVGGIGVMNIMLVSVTERTREIGIRMATGARRMDILRQFIAEALVVCSVGGLLGVVGGLGAALVARSLGSAVVFSPGPVILAFTCAFATGLLFGYMPARKAASLDPVAALAAE
jgi:macrolide transport system ATP-binding/permease protein